MESSGHKKEFLALGLLALFCQEAGFSSSDIANQDARRLPQKRNRNAGK